MNDLGNAEVQRSKVTLSLLLYITGIKVTVTNEMLDLAAITFLIITSVDTGLVTEFFTFGYIGH